MNRQHATNILAIHGVADAGRLIAHKSTKAYDVWVWENGITKRMHKVKRAAEFGWIPDYRIANHGKAKQAVATYYFALDNKFPDNWRGLDEDMLALLRVAEAIVQNETDEWRARRRASLRVVQ
jgi:hypothetical protein